MKKSLNSLIKDLENGADEALLELDSLGFFIAVDESIEEYILRLKNYKQDYNAFSSKEVTEKTVAGITLEKKNTIPENNLVEAHKITSKYYCFSFYYVLAFFDKKSSFLFGGMAVFIKNFIPFFILPKQFKTRKKWLLFRRDEILAHESCHIARDCLQSVKYEEFFAYLLSYSFLRRLLGGIFQQQKEVFILIGFISVIFGLEFFYILTFSSWSLLLIKVSSVIFISYLVFLLFRQMGVYKNFTRAKKSLSSITDYPQSLLFRCSDKEIDLIAKHRKISSKEFNGIILGELRKKLFRLKYLK